MNVKDLTNTTIFTVTAVDEITGEEMPVQVVITQDFSRVVVLFKVVQIGAPLECLSLRKWAFFGENSLVICESAEMPNITFSVTLNEEDFIALSEHPLLSKYLSI